MPENRELRTYTNFRPGRWLAFQERCLLRGKITDGLNEFITTAPFFPPIMLDVFPQPTKKICTHYFWLSTYVQNWSWISSLIFWNLNFNWMIYKDSVSCLTENTIHHHYKQQLLQLFTALISHCGLTHKEHTNSPCLPNAQLLKVTAGGIFSYQCCLNGQVFLMKTPVGDSHFFGR